LVGWLSGFRAQTGSVAYWCYATFVRRLGEAAAPGGGECGPCPDFASNTLAFALQWRKITENLRQGNRMALGCSVPNAIRLVDLAIVGDGLDWPAAHCRALGFRVRRRGKPPISLSICRVSVLRGSANQLTLSQSSRSGLWCGWQTAERPHPRVSVCYLRTRGHQ